jgi:hypothetical protein
MYAENGGFRNCTNVCHFEISDKHWRSLEENSKNLEGKIDRGKCAITYNHAGSV